MKTVHSIVLPKYSKKRCQFICDCGNVVERMYKLGIKSPNCGKCWTSQIHNTFGHLTFDDAVNPDDTTNTKKWWKCSCGNRKLITIKSVIGSKTKSCGCLCGIPMVGSCDRRPLKPIRLNHNFKYGSLTIIDSRKSVPTKEDKVLCKCDCGNTKMIKFGSISKGYTKSCGKCSSVLWPSGSEFGRLALVQPIEASPHSDKLVLCECSCGNQKKVRFSHIYSGSVNTCGECAKQGHEWWNNALPISLGYGSKKNKYSLEYLQSYFDGSYLEPLHSVDTINSSIQMMCKLCGSEFTSTLSLICGSKVISCGCINHNISRLNRAIGEAMANLGCTIEYEKKIGDKLYDLVINDRVLCECHGLRYHSTQLRDSRKVDREKFRNAISNGYKYVMVYEDEIKQKFDILIRLLSVKSGVNISKYVIRPQKLTIKRVPSRILDDLYNTNHYIGQVNATYNYAISYEDTIIAGASFRNPVRQNIGGIELCRMCIDHRYKVSGLWSWLLSKLPFNHIISYSDNRLFDGNVYRKMGFSHVGDVRQDYYWVKNNKRYHKSALRKPNGFCGTESELRESEGYFKIYDVGKKKWEYHEK